MEEILEPDNLRAAYHRVVRNKGKPGVDGMSVDQLKPYLKHHWTKISDDLLKGTYKPFPVRRVYIDKPGGGKRGLGIPTVLDRMIQQAIALILQKIWDPQFSDHSYAFRPERSAAQAIQKVKRYVVDGYRIVVDIDLEKFFDRVNHDRLMSRLSREIADKRVLQLVGRFLRAGILENGLVSPNREGTPQGGPLSPLLSNIVLDELDKELEKRNLHFVRYADDCVIYVRSWPAGERVMKNVCKFITRTLKLRVNEKKSCVSRPWKRSFLGFSVTSRRANPRIRIFSGSIERFKDKVRTITGRNRGKSIFQVIKELNDFLRGWWNYYRITETHTFLTALNHLVVRRLRSLLWKQWKRPRTRIKKLRARGRSLKDAVSTGCSRKGPWRMSRCQTMIYAFPTRYFTEAFGLIIIGH
jgi:group II intron reverse transcriptase/maturase